MITILATPYRATLDHHPDGIAVTIWRQVGRTNFALHRIHSDVIDAPFHVAADRVHELVTAMARGERAAR